MMRMNIDDGDIFLGEFANGALASIQSSYVTVGNYPGLEARVYGSEGALICRLVEESGICETRRGSIPPEDTPARAGARCFMQTWSPPLSLSSSLTTLGTTEASVTAPKYKK
jgi:predicted dehydrogenase